MESSSDSINVRSKRLNNVLLGLCGYGVTAALARAINRDSLLDAFYLLYNECSKDALCKREKNIADFVKKYKSVVEETCMLRVNITDFDIRNLIGQGHFGTVHLVVEKLTGDLYAMKKVKKSLLTSSQIREERDIMSRRCSEWITNLQYAFQDCENVYLIMEYLPGGNLLNLMTRHGPFDEALAQFYLAEITVAINTLHDMGFVHRDIKPENILIDRFGHIKLGDFGNAAAIDNEGHVDSLSPVGTPDYIAPELLQMFSAQKLTKNIHDASCDYWSMGIIGYELICEVTPFHEESVYETYSKILSHCEKSPPKNIIKYPKELNLSNQFRSLIDNLLTKPSKRLNYESLRKHAFFENVKWDSLRSQVPPIIPSLISNDDTSNFDDIQHKKNATVNLMTKDVGNCGSNNFSGNDLPFVGFTFMCTEPCSPNDIGDKENARFAKLNMKLKEEQSKTRKYLEEVGRLNQLLLKAELKTKHSTAQSQTLDDAKEEVVKMKRIIKEKNNELINWRTQMKTLQNSLRIEQEMWEKKEATITELLRMNRQKYEEAKLAAEARYEKHILEKKIETEAMHKKLAECESKLSDKVEQCVHLQKKLENYQEILKQHKEKARIENEEFEKNKAHLSDLYERKLAEMRTRMRHENDKKLQLSMEMRDMRTELEDSRSCTKALEEIKASADKGQADMIKRLNSEIDQNNDLRKENSELQKKLYELEKNEKQLEKTIERLDKQLQDTQQAVHTSPNRSVSLCCRCKTLAETGTSFTDNEEILTYETAPGSMNDIRIVEEQLRADLLATKESEINHKERADKLQNAVEKLECMLQKYNDSTISKGDAKESQMQTSNQIIDSLQKKNELLEVKLSETRELMIIERQSARSANLSLWKLEKKLEEINLEKKQIQRRMELTEERLKKVQMEKDSAIRLQEVAEERARLAEDRISEIKLEVDKLKSEAVTSCNKLEESKKELAASKTEVIHHVSNCQMMQDKVNQLQHNLHLSQQKLEKFDLENKNLIYQINEEKERYSNSNEQLLKLQIEHQTLKDNYERLKYACTVTDNQLTEVEAMLQKEQTCNKSNQEMLQKLYKQIRSNEDEESVLRNQLMNQEMSNQTAQSKIAALNQDVQERDRLIHDLQVKYSKQQENLIDQSGQLLKTQEKLEVLQNENQNIQSLCESFEKELLSTKEENSRILSDLFHSKEEAQCLQQQLADKLVIISDLQNQVQELKRNLEEKETFYLHRDIKSEATLAQHKKLIDYLQIKVEELSQKKKKTLADKLFGNNHTDAGCKNEQAGSFPIEKSILYRTLQQELNREKLRSKTLLEKMDKLELDKNQASAKNKECRRSLGESKEINENINAVISKEANKTQDIGTSSEMPNVESTKHRFELAIQEYNLNSTLCFVCKNDIAEGTSCWKCKECKIYVHRKCRADVKISCGETEKEMVADYLKIPLDSSSSKEIEKNSVIESSYRTYNDDDSKPPETLVFEISSNVGEKLLEVICAYEIDAGNILLLGCTTGLYALHVFSKNIVHIAGIDSVSYLSVSSILAKAIMVGSQGESLYQCDLRHLLSRCQSNSSLSQLLEASVLDLPFANRALTEKWNIVEISPETERPLNTVAVAATSSRIVILNYDVKQQKFKPVRALDTATSVISIFFTRHTAIVASDKFFEIDMSSFCAEEFIDISDKSVSHTKNFTPIVAFRISNHEFLLCFLEGGIFVDEYGCRSRPYDIDWECTPCNFLYQAPFLYVAHFQTIQIIRIHRSYSQEVEMGNEKDLDADIDSSVPDMKRYYLPFYMPTILAKSKEFDAYILATGKCTRLKEIHHLNPLHTIKRENFDLLETTSTSTSVSLQSVQNVIHK